jgi:hypothetical protein
LHSSPLEPPLKGLGKALQVLELPLPLSEAPEGEAEVLVGAGDVAVEVRPEVALPEPLDDPVVRSPLVAKVVDRVVVDMDVSLVLLNVAYGLPAPGAGHTLGGMRSLLAFNARAPLSKESARP